MSPEAQRLRAENNLARLSDSDQRTVRCMVCSSVEETRYYTKMMVATPGQNAQLILETALDYEKAHSCRATVLHLISAARKKIAALDSSTDHRSPITDPSAIALAAEDHSIPSPAALITGNPSTALSPIEVAAITATDTAWEDAARLAGLIKNYARAGTAAKALCGIRLRALREHYAPKGGRPKKSDTGTWESLLADKLGITRQTALVWIQMADAVEAIADAQGLDLRTTCEKLPWDWSTEESAMIDATVTKLCEDRTQRQLLQADFLSDLGYREPDRPNSSNNPLGKNGGKKAPAANPGALLKQRQIAARILLYGTEAPGKVALGSHARFLIDMVNNNGLELEALPKAELQNYYDHDLKPFVDLIRKLIQA